MDYKHHLAIKTNFKYPSVVCFPYFDNDPDGPVMATFTDRIHRHSESASLILSHCIRFPIENTNVTNHLQCLDRKEMPILANKGAVHTCTVCKDVDIKTNVKLVSLCKVQGSNIHE